MTKSLFWGMALSLAVAGIGCGDDDSSSTTDGGSTTTTDGGSTTTTDGGGTTVVDTPDQCVEECSEDADCMVNVPGSDPVDSGLVCSDDSRCVTPCEEDVECQLSIGESNTDCSTSEECTAPFVCIAVGDGGKCVVPLDPPCQTGFVETTVKDIDDEDVTLCALERTCDSANQCVGNTTVTSDFDCNEPEMDCPENFECDTASGDCKCSNDEACGGRGVCDMDSGFCECNDASSDCTADSIYSGTDFVCGSL